MVYKENLIIPSDCDSQSLYSILFCVFFLLLDVNWPKHYLEIERTGLLNVPDLVTQTNLGENTEHHG